MPGLKLHGTTDGWCVPNPGNGRKSAATVLATRHLPIDLYTRHCDATDRFTGLTGCNLIDALRRALKLFAKAAGAVGALTSEWQVSTVSLPLNVPPGQFT